MRIGLLASDLTPSHGWGNYSLSVIQSLQKLNHDLTIVTAKNSPSLAETEIHPILPTTTPPERYSVPKMLATYPQISSILKDCDIIHTTVELYAPLAHFLSGGRPHFMTAHGSYINLPRVRRFPMNKVYERAFTTNHIICVSHYTQRVARSIVPEAKISVILNAIDSQRFTTIEHAGSDVPTIITVGGVKARKGTLELVEAVAKVRESLPDVRCEVIGSTNAEPGYVAKVREAINRLNLQDTVTLHGFVDDDTLQAMYARATVFSLPSINASWKFEGFGLSTLEASAAGLPVISTWGCGSEDAIDHEKTGLLVSQENIREELPEALLQILTKPDLARAMGKAGQAKATSHTWDDVASQLVEIYQTTLND